MVGIVLTETLCAARILFTFDPVTLQISTSCRAAENTRGNQPLFRSYSCATSGVLAEVDKYNVSDFSATPQMPHRLSLYTN